MDGRLKRFDTGINFLPRKSVFRSDSMLSVDDVIWKKYLMNGTNRCGYMSGMRFANKIGLTTQVSSIYEIYTNNATKDYRETRIANLKVIIRKPYVKVDEYNASILQFLDLLKEVMDLSEIEGEELTSTLVEYMRKKNIKFEGLRRFLSYYPERINKNMYEVGLAYLHENNEEFSTAINMASEKFSIMQNFAVKDYLKLVLRELSKRLDYIVFNLLTLEVSGL